MTSKLQSGIILLMLAVFGFLTLVSCGSSGGGSSDSESTQSVTLSGQATIPGYLPAGSLWLVADGLDGESYGSGASDAQGNFSLDVSLTGQSESVLVYAVDPDDPEMYAMALVPVVGLAKGVGAQSEPEDGQIYIDGESTAEVFVTMVSGLSPAEFTPLEEALKDSLMDQYVMGAPNLCSVEQTPIFIDDKIEYINAIKAFFDVFVNEDGVLMLRLKRAQDKATKYVTSLNQYTGWRLDEGTGLLTTLSLVRIRATLRLYLGEDFGLQGGLTRKTISREDLEKAANIIVNPEGLTGGYGNCREKGIVGAYIASRFKEFKQVAYVAAETELYSQAHGFAIACQQDETVWDINNLISKWDTDVPVPDGLYEADCIIIDPWAGITRELTPETVAGLKWKWMEHVMKVDLVEADANASPLVYRALATDSRGTFIPESIPSDAELIAAICDPFTIPQDIDPSADEICDDGIDNDGDDDVDCDDADCTEDAACKEIETWYIWYVDNISLNPVMVGTNESFEADRLCSSYPGGGMSPTTLMDKIAIVEGYETKAAAIEAACSQFTNIRAVPASSTFVWTDWLADLGGERHDIDELGGCQ